jgi:hypothetical protein
MKIKKIEIKDNSPGIYNLTVDTKDKIDHFVKLTLNSLSYHDVNKHEISSEIRAAIDVIKNLKTELNV